MEGFEDKQNRGLIIFDFDGTLGDTRRNIVTTMQMTIAELHLPSRSEEECAATIGLPLAGCFRTLFPDIQAVCDAEPTLVWSCALSPGTGHLRLWEIDAQQQWVALLFALKIAFIDAH